LAPKNSFAPIYKSGFGVRHIKSLGNRSFPCVSSSICGGMNIFANGVAVNPIYVLQANKFNKSRISPLILDELAPFFVSIDA